MVITIVLIVLELSSSIEVVEESSSIFMLFSLNGGFQQYLVLR